MRSRLSCLMVCSVSLIATAGCMTVSSPSEEDVETGAMPVESAACAVEYRVIDRWPGGFQSEVKLTNKGSGAYNGWTLTWTFPGGQGIQNLWNGIATQSGAKVQVTNQHWNPRLNASASTSLGFVASGDPAGVPTDFAVNGVRCNGGSSQEPNPPSGGSAPPAGGSGSCSATYEAENMTHGTGGAYTGGWNIWSNGSISTQHSFVAGANAINVVAKGEQAGGAPHMKVSIAGQVVYEKDVPATSWTNYSFEYKAASAGTKEIKVEFTNDYYAAGADRNLLVDKVSVKCGSAGTAPDPGTNPGTNPNPGGNDNPSPPPVAPDAPRPSGSAVAAHGKLRVCGNRICNKNGQVVQLRGISTHGVQWYGWNQRCLNSQAMDSLSKEWKADIIRIAQYVQEGGYETDPAKYRAMVDTIVDEAGKRGVYALIDWHILNPGDPMYNLDRAKDFFKYMAQKHGKKEHVLFEIANEPNGVGWSTIQNYAQQILRVIRHDQGSDTVTIIGTPDWSSLGKSGGHSPDDIVKNPPLDASTNGAYKNIMYTFHFYAASHVQDYRDMVRVYADKIPLFVTEWGTPTYSGDGFVDEANTRAWIELMREKRLSWCYWNWSDNGQSGALFKPGTCDGGRNQFSGSVLQRSGEIIFSALTQ